MQNPHPPTRDGMTRYFWILTLAFNGGYVHRKGVIDLAPGASREAVYEQIRAYVMPQDTTHPDAAPVFFSLDPDTL